MEDLQDTLRDQQDLSDDSFSELQDRLNPNRPQQGQQGQPGQMQQGQQGQQGQPQGQGQGQQGQTSPDGQAQNGQQPGADGQQPGAQLALDLLGGERVVLLAPRPHREGLAGHPGAKVSRGLIQQVGEIPAADAVDLREGVEPKQPGQDAAHHLGRWGRDEGPRPGVFDPAVHPVELEALAQVVEHPPGHSPPHGPRLERQLAISE